MQPLIEHSTTAAGFRTRLLELERSEPGPVLCGDSLGGLIALPLAAAGSQLRRPLRGTGASPFDFARVPLVAPLRPIAAVTQGQLAHSSTARSAPRPRRSSSAPSSSPASTST